MGLFKKPFTLYILSLILGLFIILFARKEFDSASKSSIWTVSPTGYMGFRQGIDIAGGVSLKYKVDFTKYAQLYTEKSALDAAEQNALNIILTNIDKRISALGVSDYVARKQKIGNDRFIAVEIGGVNLDNAKAIIGKTVELEFKVPASLASDQKALATQRQAMIDKLFADIKANPSNVYQYVSSQLSNDVYPRTISGEAIADLAPLYTVNKDTFATAKPGDIINLGKGIYMAGGSGMQTTKDIQASVLVLVQSYTGGKLSGLEIAVLSETQWIVAVDTKTNNTLNGAYFKNANVSSSQLGKPVVAINFDDTGKDMFCSLTKKYNGKQMAIFVGGQLVTSPTINEPICGGSAQIDGGFDAAGAKALAASLNEGALPAPLILSSEEQISPALGQGALQGAIYAAGVALVLIFGFLLLLYDVRLAMIGFAVLVSYVIYLLAAMKLIDYALSLSGIAAIILSFGMGVDATILIFERLREELSRGKSITSAIDIAMDRSRHAILDGNMTTICIFAILALMGMSIFKGFGFAGIITSLLILWFVVPLTKLLLQKFATSSKA